MGATGVSLTGRMANQTFPQLLLANYSKAWVLTCPLNYRLTHVPNRGLYMTRTTLKRDKKKRHRGVYSVGYDPSQLTWLFTHLTIDLQLVNVLTKALTR